MEYPSGFPPQSRAAVEAEEVRASRDFNQARQRLPWSKYGPGEDLAAEVRTYILRIYAVFVREACKLGGVWGVDRIRSCAREFLRILTIKAWSEKGYDTGGTVYPGQTRHLPDMTSHGAISPEVMGKFEKSVQWRESEGALLEVAEAQAVGGRVPGAGEAGTAAPAQFPDRAEGRSPIVEGLAEPTSSCGAVGDNEKRASKRRHGFKADMVRHERIASVVDRHAPSWRTGSTTFSKTAVLEKICTDLDEAEVDIPDSWRRGTTPSLQGAKVKNWKDALELGLNKLVADQLRTSLNRVRHGTAAAAPGANGDMDC